MLACFYVPVITALRSIATEIEGGELLGSAAKGLPGLVGLDLPPGGGHRGYTAMVDGSGLMVAWRCSHSMGGM
jgi:hypothetical protein